MSLRSLLPFPTRATRQSRAGGSLPATALALALAFLAAVSPGSARPASAAGNPLVDSGFALQGAMGTDGGRHSSLTWADYDGDGDLDLLLLGATTQNATSALSRLYRNDGGALVSVATAVPGLMNATAAWGDYDGDGDLDLVVSGINTSAVATTQLLRNDAGTLTAVASGLPGVSTGALAWGDVDNDGDLDLLLTGTTINGSATGGLARIYLNNGGVFTDAGYGFEESTFSSAALADLDRDGDLDCVIAGQNAAGTRKTNVYRNDGGSFALLATLAGSSGGQLAIGDLDGNGTPDIVLTGTSGGAAGGFTKVYLTDAGGTAFSDAGTIWAGGYTGSVALGDYDEDGDLDLVLAGFDLSEVRQAFLVRNDGGVFTSVSSGLTAMAHAALAWGDQDGDGRLDLAAAGSTTGSSTGPSAPVTRLNRNATVDANAPPAAPTGLSASIAAGRVTFAWTAPTDDHTAQASLTYELRVGTSPGGSEITGAAANTATGFRRVAQAGSAGTRTTWTLALPPGTYYWSVQAVDAGFRGGAFAAEQTLPVTPLVNSGAALAGVMGPTSGNRPCLTWADYDVDGDLDLLAIGATTTSLSSGVSTLYRNDAGTLVAVASAVPGLASAVAAWGDYDRDGDPDLIVAGYLAGSGTATTQLLRNDAGTFVPVASGLPAITSGALVWADFDNDGDLDLLLSGNVITAVYLNGGGTFTDGGFGLEGLRSPTAAAADFDRDGDLDLVASGINGSNIRKTNVYRNDGGSFALLTTLAGLSGGNVVVGNIDENGSPDIVLNGTTASPSGEAGGQTKVYLNNGSGTAFTDAGLVLPGGYTGAVALGDYDADGDLDFAWSGFNTAGVRKTYLARNTAGVFALVDSSMAPVSNGALAWADVDGDGRLDLALAGASTGTANTPTGPVTRLYRNVMGRSNAPPSAPPINQVFPDGNKLRVYWGMPADDATPSYSLTYDVMLGTTYQGGEIAPLTGLLPSGRRTTVRGGDWRESTLYHLDNLAPGVYYVRVQAVDASFAGSSLEGWTGFAYNVTGVGEDPTGPPTGRLELSAVRPNPMTAQARIDFELPRAADVDLVVFDVAGRKVRTLLKDRMAAGRQVALWDGTDGDGRRAPAGVYFVHLAADGETRSQRVIVAR